MDELYHKRWRPAEVCRLTELFITGHTPEDIARKLERNLRAVKSKVWRLGLQKKKRQGDHARRRNLDCMPNPFGWMK